MGVATSYVTLRSLRNNWEIHKEMALLSKLVLVIYKNSNNGFIQSSAEFFFTCRAMFFFEDSLGDKAKEHLIQGDTQ